MNSQKKSAQRGYQRSIRLIVIAFVGVLRGILDLVLTVRALVKEIDAKCVILRAEAKNVREALGIKQSGTSFWLMNLLPTQRHFDPQPGSNPDVDVCGCTFQGPEPPYIMDFIPGGKRLRSSLRMQACLREALSNVVCKAVQWNAYVANSLWLSSEYKVLLKDLKQRLVDFDRKLESERSSTGVFLWLKIILGGLRTLVPERLINLLSSSGRLEVLLNVGDLLRLFMMILLMVVGFIIVASNSLKRMKSKFGRDRPKSVVETTEFKL